MRQLRWVEAARAAEEGIHIGRTSHDLVLHSTFLLLRAEARAVLGDLAGAGTDIVDATGPHDEMPLDMLAEVHRVIGRTLAREGDRRGAAVAYRRSARILHAMGHLRGQHDVEAEAAEDRVSTTPDAAPGEIRPDLLLGRAMAALDQSARPDLLGAELLALARETGCTSAALVSRSATDLAVNGVTGWTEADAIAAAATAAAPIELGRWRDRDWMLIADVAPTVGAQTTWMAIRTLARAGAVLANTRRDARESKALWPIENPDTPSPGIFISEQMTELVRVAKKVAAVNYPVLITGETGVGKDVFAHIVHDSSGRAGKPFVPYNCATVPRDLLESQLFGHRRGAFTGADHASPGVIRTAAGGTLFLDEIGELPLDLQAKLLRFIENGEIHPLGEPQPIRVDVRIVAATNRDLDEHVREGTLRKDLFFRLQGVQLQIPPLRERREEIPRLAWHFLERCARTHQKGRLRLADDTMEYLVLYAWPGNVRELINEMQRMAAFAETDAVLMPQHLSTAITGSRRTRPASELDLHPTEVVVRVDQPMSAATEHLERTMVQYAMTQHRGNVEQVARALGLSRKGLYLKRRRLGLDIAV